MNKLFVLLALCLVSSCGVSIELPGVDTTLVCEMESGCPMWEPDEVVTLLDRYHAIWQKRFDADVSDPATITVRDHIWGGIDFEEDGARVIGYASGRDVVVVGRDLDSYIDLTLYEAEPRFFHELTHLALKETTGNSGRDHNDGIGPWNDDVDKALAVLSAHRDLPMNDENRYAQ